MATSPSHTLGELIGNFFESVMKSPIKALCTKYNVYFDSFGERPARTTKKLSWQDINGSTHDLEYVIERNGTNEKTGDPIAFIELAWRRYTKHSKNKVQEISSAIVPIAEKYKEFAPFKGVILSGEFTDSSLKQLENLGFHILYIPFDNVVASFKKYGVDIFFDESTKEKDLAKIVKSFEKCKKIDLIKEDFIDSNKDKINTFLASLETCIKRQISYIYVLPLHGKEERFSDITHAIDFILKYTDMPDDAIIDRYIIGIAYNDGSLVNCMFKDKTLAVDFLKRNTFS